MPSVQQLYEQRKQLEKLIDLINQKILSLRTSRVTTIDPGALASIDIQIEQYTQEREQAKQEVAEIDKAIAIQNQEYDLQPIDSSSQLTTTDELYNALLNLDYQVQTVSFRQFIRKKLAAAFLIHGARKHGQRWLLNRLVRKHVSNIVTDKVVPFRLKRVAHSNDISALWRELAERVGLERKDSPPSPSDVANRVYNWLQTQNVILVFHDIEHMPSEFLPELIEQFWQPLVNKILSIQSQNSSSQLLMFLIDYTGRICNQNLAFTERYEVSWSSEIPIKLPILDKFTENILSTWLANQVDILPLEFIDEVDDTVQNILANSEDGTPEYVLDEICSWCGRDWEEETRKWLKL